MEANRRFVYKFTMSISHYRKMMQSKTFGNAMWKRIMLLVIWFIFSMIFILDKMNRIELSQVVYVCSLLVFIALPMAWITMEINIWKYYSAYKNGLKGERKIAVDNNGFTFTNVSSDVEGSNSWSDISRIEEMKDLFLIEINRKEAVILPKKSMGDNRKIELFKELAREKIPGRFKEISKKEKVQN